MSMCEEGTRPTSIQMSDKEVLEHLNSKLDVTPLVRDFRTGVTSKNEVFKAIEEAGPKITETMDNVYTLLHPFSVLGEYDIVKKLWEHGVRPTSGEKTCTVLHCAVRTYPPFGPRDEDRAKLLRLFLSAKETHGEHLHIDKKSECGMTALRIATCLRLENCVEVLLEHGASAKPPDGENYSLLHYALGNPAIIKMLLNAYSGNINWQDSDGRTALLLAIETGKVESALTLLERGANPNIRNNEGIAPLFQAAKMGQMEVVRALVRCKSDINAPGGGQGITALHWAAFKEMEELVVFLIENGADVTIADTKGRTPLSMVSEKLQLKMKEVVSRCSPGVCPTTLAASPAMTAERKAMEACCHGNISALCNLIKSGVDVNFRCKQTESSLIHRAAYYGQASVVVFLSHHGANVKAVDKDQDTVLHFATMKEFPHGSHSETLHFLIGMQVDLNAQNRLGDTPLMLATRNCLTRRVRTLLKSKADVDIANNRGETPLHVACHSIQSIEILFHIVECSKDLNKKDSSGLTPLMHAVTHGCVSAAKYLLLKGAQPDIQDPQGKTALYQATENLNFDMAEVLVMAGADVNIPSFEKNLSPSHIATQKRNKLMLKLLLEFGGDVNVADSDGNTVLDMIPSPHLREAIKVLVRARDELRSEFRAPRDKNAPGPAVATPTSSAFSNCATLSVCNEFLPCNDTAAASNQERGDCGLGRISEPVGEDNECVLSTSDLHWGQNLVNQRSLQSESSVEDDRLEESEEKEVEEETCDEIEDEESGVEEELTLERFQRLQSELSSLRSAYAESKKALRCATKHNEELHDQITLLERRMELKQSQMVSRHLHHAVTFSMHAICHNVLQNQTDNDGLNGHTDSTGTPLLNSHRAATMGSMESGISSMTADDRDHPVCDREELSDGIDCTRCNEKRQEYQTLAEKRSDSLESSGSEVSGEESFKYVMAGIGLHSKPLFQPINHTKIQWWMVSKSDYELTDESLNENSEPSSRFFDVNRGTFRHIDVAVRTVRDVTSWNIENYLSFIKEVNFLSCLHCPWIVQFLCGCFDAANETCSIVNEYMARGSLHSVLHEKKVELSSDTRMEIVRDVSFGMLFLHSHRILHRHLNPSNILIGEHFNAKLNDFGLHETKLKSGHYKLPNHTHQAYMAPEALGKQDFTMATDTYSFGIIMFECWTSEKAFANLLGNPMAMGVQLMMGARPSFPSNSPSEFEALATRCWHKDPEIRPPFEDISSSLKEMKLSST